MPSCSMGKCSLGRTSVSMQIQRAMWIVFKSVCGDQNDNRKSPWCLCWENVLGWVSKPFFFKLQRMWWVVRSFWGCLQPNSMSASLTLSWRPHVSPLHFTIWFRDMIHAMLNTVVLTMGIHSQRSQCFLHPLCLNPPMVHSSYWFSFPSPTFLGCVWHRG